MNENTRTSMENAIGEVKVSPKTEMAGKIYTKTDSLFSIIYIALGYLFVRWFFFDTWYTNFDYTLPIYTIMYVFTVVMYARSKGRQISKESIFWICVLAAAAILFKIENYFRLLTAIFVAAYFTALCGNSLYSGGTSSYIAMDIYNCFIALPFANFFSIFPAIFNLFKRKKKREKITISPAVWGVVLAAVALWFILPLLVAADSNFLSGAKEFIEYLGGMLFGSFDLTTIVIHLIFATPVTCYLYGLAYGSMSEEKYGSFEKADVDTTRHKMRISPALTLKVFLYIVCFVYVLFIALQAEYLLGAFMGRLYSGMTYAQYARTGFFELCNVASINLSLLMISNLLIKQDEYRAIKLPMTVLCILSLLLLSTATAKMAMYISVYGLTVKRVISTVFLLWLIIVFVMCIIRIYKPFNLVKVAVITGAVMFCILFSFDIGLHSHKFNEKYGFNEEAVEKEYYTGLILPNAENVEKIHCTYFSNDKRVEFEIDSPMDIMSMLEKATETNRQSVQDFPVANEYYQLNIICPDYDCLTIFIYQYNGYFYAEQPYQAICECNYDWDEIFSNYYDITEIF